MLTVDFKKRVYAREALEHVWFKAASAQPIIDRSLMKEALDNLKGFNATQKMGKIARCARYVFAHNAIWW